jgi:hypothetical protein
MRRMLIAAAALALTATALFGQSLQGTFRLVQDSNGTAPRKGAVIDLAFSPDGTFSFKAVQPGETVTDSGTYSVAGRTSAAPSSWRAAS